MARSPELEAAPEFSALITCYFEAESIGRFHEKLSKALAGLGRSYEIILVNDGSTDATWQKIKDLFDKDPKITVALDLFKNSGQQAAITAALNEARGRAFILLDSDLQLDPAELPMLVAEYDKGFDVVSGYRQNRRDSFWRILPSKIANMIMRRASQSRFRDFGCTFKIYNADLVRAFDFGPHRIFSNVDCIAAAQRQCEVPVTHYPRPYGQSGWTFRKLWAYNMDNIVRLTQRPFQILAVLCVIASGLFALRILSGFILPFKIMGEVTTGLLLNALFLVFLALLAVLSMIGEFTIRSFTTLHRIPAYIVRERISRVDAAPQDRVRDA